MKKFIIHPFLFALFNILFLFSHNIDQVYKFEFLLPTTIALGITLLLVLLSILIFRDYNKATIIISISIILFFSYGRIFDLIANQYIGNFEVGRHRYLMFIWGLLFAGGAYLIIRGRSDLQQLTKVLNITALSLVLIPLYNIGVYQLNKKNIQLYDKKCIECLDLTASDFEEVTEYRDIYYIILDGYASTSTLKDVCGYDNQNFNNYLISKGFYVASKSQSNYPMTFL
ncbi:MAG: hypothetical protein GWP19_15865, partial [Planctomycetia bacterium]|nr:hypothetical protein [Planctomycetia bacterium]